MLNTSEMVAFGNGDSLLPTDTPTTGVRSVSATARAFAALYLDGSVRAWGHDSYGGSSSFCVMSDANTKTSCLSLSSLSDVKEVTSNHAAFVVIFNSGAVKAWGRETAGGALPSDTSIADSLNAGVVAVHASPYSFCATKVDVSLICWGHGMGGGVVRTTPYVTLFTTWNAFAGLTAAGGLEVWGDINNGGTISSDFPTDLKVSIVFSSSSAFAALMEDGSLRCWGNQHNGGACNVDTSVKTRTRLKKKAVWRKVVTWSLRPSMRGGKRVT